MSIAHRCALCLALSLVACDDEPAPRTQIVVVVDSDLETPDELDEVRVEVRSVRDGAEAVSAGGAVASGRERLLPLTLGVEPAGDELGPVTVTARGRLEGATIVRRSARVSFVRGQTRALQLVLERSCLNAVAPECDAAQTCVHGSCKPQEVAEADLPHFDGVPDPVAVSMPPDSIDAGGRDAATDAGQNAGDDACVGSDEICNERDDDCDGEVDEDFDLGSLAHCGSCDHACPMAPPFAASACVQGKCELVCAPGTANCDDDVMTGCDTKLDDPQSCGSCTTSCEGDTPLCAGEGTSAGCVATCSGDKPDQCDSSCVDTGSDPFHCGNCETACPAPANAEAMCDGGTCGAACLGRYADCNDSLEDGCETDLEANLDHCNACDNACPERAHAVRTCAGGTCGYRCQNGYADCNGEPGDGCEVNTNDDKANCGGCASLGENQVCTGLQGCCAGACRLLSLCN